MSKREINISLLSPISILLFILFYLAKIFDKIDWSWWWVFSPLWIPLAIAICILITIGLLYLIIKIIELWKKYF